MNIRADYHVHYHLDLCATDEMRLPAIENMARNLDLAEITILKHYSEQLPNGESDWVYWHTVKPNEFEQFISDMKSYKPKTGLKIYSGAETELLDGEGNINISDSAISRLDMVTLSVHFMPSLPSLPKKFCYRREDTSPEAIEAFKKFNKMVSAAGTEKIISELAEAYIKAICRNPCVRVLAHMCDGLKPLRDYGIDVDSLSENKLVELMEPLMHTAKNHGVLWELCPDKIIQPAVLKRANEIGVLFTPTADAHALENNSWGNFTDWSIPFGYIKDLGLKCGQLKICD